MMEEAFRRVPREEIFEYTGIQFLQLNSLYQLLAMAVQKSPLLDTAQTFLNMPDLSSSARLWTRARSSVRCIQW
jgi:rhamnulokinase